MSHRMLMATVAALALAIPAAAQEQPKTPLDTEQEATQPFQEPVQDQSAPGGAPAIQPGDQATEPTEAEQPPVAAEEPAETPAEQEVTEEKEATPPPDMTFIRDAGRSAVPGERQADR